VRRAQLAAALAVAALALLIPATASAHIQVRPANAAPLDPTLWTVLVPSERDAGTVEVKLKIPPGVVPFSFEDRPGWKRTIQKTRDGGIDTVTWTGRTAPDGLAEFQFLATPDDRERTIEWKALQTYSDGKTVSWIGPPGSENPASTTVVSKDTPPQNAGGEGGAAGPTSNATETADSDDSGDSNTLPTILAGLAFLVAIVALGVALRRPKRLD
jgi:uncharacterized protein YcnI